MAQPGTKCRLARGRLILAQDAVVSADVEISVIDNRRDNVWSDLWVLPGDALRVRRLDLSFDSGAHGVKSSTPIRRAAAEKVQVVCGDGSWDLHVHAVSHAPEFLSLIH